MFRSFSESRGRLNGRYRSPCFNEDMRMPLPSPPPLFVPPLPTGLVDQCHSHAFFEEEESKVTTEQPYCSMMKESHDFHKDDDDDNLLYSSPLSLFMDKGAEELSPYSSEGSETITMKDTTMFPSATPAIPAMAAAKAVASASSTGAAVMTSATAVPSWQQQSQTIVVSASNPEGNPPSSTPMASLGNGNATRRNRAWYLTKNLRTGKNEVRVWPGIHNAGPDAHLAEVPEFVGERTVVSYPNNKDPYCVETRDFPSAWVIWLDRRYFPRDEWNAVEHDVRGCNKFASNVGTPKLCLFDRHWGRIVWAKPLPSNRNRTVDEYVRVQIHRPKLKNRSTLTVGIKLGYERNGNRNHTCLPCNVCHCADHRRDVSPCVMIIADCMPPPRMQDSREGRPDLMPPSLSPALPDSTAVVSAAFSSDAPQTPPIYHSDRGMRRSLSESQSSDDDEWTGMDIIGLQRKIRRVLDFGDGFNLERMELVREIGEFLDQLQSRTEIDAQTSMMSRMSIIEPSTPLVSPILPSLPVSTLLWDENKNNDDSSVVVSHEEGAESCYSGLEEEASESEVDWVDRLDYVDDFSAAAASATTATTMDDESGYFGDEYGSGGVFDIDAGTMNGYGVDTSQF